MSLSLGNGCYSIKFQPPLNPFQPNSRMLEMYFVRAGDDLVEPPGVESLLPAKDVEAMLASQSVMDTVPGVNVDSVYSQVSLSVTVPGVNVDSVYSQVSLSVM